MSGDLSPRAVWSDEERSPGEHFAVDLQRDERVDEFDQEFFGLDAAIQTLGDFEDFENASTITAAKAHAPPPPSEAPARPNLSLGLNTELRQIAISNVKFADRPRIASLKRQTGL